jgi:hypothetical protein
MKNKSILNESIDEVVDEVLEESFGGGGSAFGGAPGGGSGTFSWTSRLKAPQHQSGSPKTHQPGSPPYRGMTGSPGGLNIQDIAQESEAIAKAAGKLPKPYPLDQVNEFLVNAFLELSNAESQLTSCVKYNKVLTDQEEKKIILDHCLKKVQATKELIKAISKDFDRITLS